MRLSILMRLVAVFILTPTVTGCAGSMAMVRSSYKDTSILHPGADRTAVIAGLGAPDASVSIEDGSHIEIYRIDPNAHSEGSKRFTAVSHLILTTGTLGLWELIGMPIELALRDRPLTFVLQYDKEGKLFGMESVNEWRPTTVDEADRTKCHQQASLEAIGVVPSEGYENPIAEIQSAFKTSKDREDVYQRVLLQCLLSIHAQRIR